MINIIEKIRLIIPNLDNTITVDKLENIICNILVTDFEQYIDLCKKKDNANAITYIINMSNNGYSVIDLLEEFFIYIKNHSDLDDKYKFKIIKQICNYINIFNNIHEDNIELIFLTNNIIKILNNF